MYDIIIKNGLIVTSVGIKRGDVSIKNGKVVGIEARIFAPAKRYVSAEGKFVFPGFLDVHAHPVYLDDMGKLSLAAAYGGITTIIHYAYAKPGQGLVETIQYFIQEGKKKSVLDFALHAGLFDPKYQIQEIPEAMRLGVTSFKLFMAYAKLGWMTDDYQLVRAFDTIAQVGGMAMVHAENGLATDYLEDKFIAEGRDPREVFEMTRPGILEAEAVNRAIALAQVGGCPIYIPHVSAKEAVEIIAQSKDRGWQVYGETCPQYLTLTGEEVFKQGALAKIGPPLRRLTDQRALWKGLRNGTLDVIASDHAPKEKTQETDFFQSPFGSPQVETMVPIVYEVGVNGGQLTLSRFVQLLSENPARIFGLYPRKGAIQVGSDADIVIFDPEEEFTVTVATQHSRASYTLYEGWKCLGRPVLSLQRGEVVLEKDEVVTKPGRGLFIPTNAGKVAPKELMPA
ncbi:MAG: dihydropyrimidinase [Candidatus Methanomethyliaceae archaeon]